MKLGKLGEFYYSAAEARKVLGIDEDTFQYWGKVGRISRIYLPGRKHPVYSKKEINDISDKIEATVITEQAKGTQYRNATIDDLEEENQLAQLVFGRAAGAMPRKMYLETNPEIDYHLYDYGKLVAYLTIFPLKKETLTRFIHGEIRGWQINPDDIEQFAPGKPLECLIMDMVTTPLVPPTKRSEYGRLMLVNFLKTFRQWGERGVEITKLHAIGSTPEGQHILNTAHFKEAGKVGTGRIAFELDIENTDARILRTYKEALAQWKQQQNSTTTFSVATAEDAQGIYDVIASLWGTLHTTPVEIRLNWYQKNPAIDYIVKKDDRVAGYITIMPLKHETIEKLMEGKLRGWDIKAEDMLPFTPGVPLECFTGIAVRAGVKQPKKYGMRLLMGIMETMLEFAREGIFIKRLYAVSDTLDGVKLSRDLGFEETPPAPGSTFGQFVLDLQTSNSPYAEEYRRALNTKESQNGHQTEQHENATSGKPRITKVAKPTTTT